MNTVKQWMRATRALGFALVITTAPASAAVVNESLIDTSANPDSHTVVCDATTSVMAFSPTPGGAPQRCASSQAEQHNSPAPGQQQHRFAEPASGSFWSVPMDGRRYSF
ncbi:hypothetical protein CXK91_00350 [Stutzerimonas stutzeri]|uniref:Secreted protein n=1 Tax=Stutzerimonas stutzeri TaxID=316 RepID=A0A2S4ASM1_STUST|nr:hypothetical protein CXK91_00350 [Stutzerimonas stutzeri]